MSGFRTIARGLARHWLLVVAVLVNIAIASPLGAIRWNNDVCGTPDGGLKACCTTCLFFCSCDILGGPN